LCRSLAFLLFPLAVSGQNTHPILAIGSAAPDFSLPDVDGNTHRLMEYASSPILVVVFTCNRCPIAQMYERRIQQVDLDYCNKGVAVIAIQPKDPHAMRIDELVLPTSATAWRR
jgi:peroxiredoxin